MIKNPRVLQTISSSYGCYEQTKEQTVPLGYCQCSIWNGGCELFRHGVTRRGWAKANEGSGKVRVLSLEPLAVHFLALQAVHNPPIFAAFTGSYISSIGSVWATLWRSQRLFGVGFLQ